MTRFNYFLILLCLLSGCAHRLSSHTAAKADSLAVTLLPPASFGQNLGFTQNAEINFDGEQHQLIFATEITADSIVVVGTLPNGTRVFTISFDGETVTSQSYANVIEQIGAEYFLADLQLAQWPIQTLTDQLRHASPCTYGGCTLVESESGLSRTLTRNGETLVSINYSDSTHYRGQTHVAHLQRAYEITVTTIDVYEL